MSQKILGLAVLLLTLQLGLACSGGEGERAPSVPPATGTVVTTEEASTPVKSPLPLPKISDGPEPSGRIAFLSFRAGNREIYVMDVEDNR